MTKLANVQSSGAAIPAQAAVPGVSVQQAVRQLQDRVEAAFSPWVKAGHLPSMDGSGHTLASHTYEALVHSLAENSAIPPRGMLEKRMPHLAALPGIEDLLTHIAGAVEKAAAQEWNQPSNVNKPLGRYGVAGAFAEEGRSAMRREVGTFLWDTVHEATDGWLASRS